MEGFGEDAEGNCRLLARDRSSPEDVDTQVQDTGSSEPPLQEGDPIRVIATSDYLTWEFLDAEVLDAERAVVVGQGGIAIVSLEDGSMLWSQNTERGYRVAVDGDQAYVAARTGRIYQANVGSSPSVGALHFLDGWHEDIAADDGVVALASLDSGVLLMDGKDLSLLGQVDGAQAQGVALLDGRLLVADGETLSLYDVSDVSSPRLLHSVELRGVGRDIAFDGSRVAVALGARGVDLFEVDGDVLSKAGDVALPGSAAGVDLDGDYLWVGAWEVTALVWLGEGGPLTLGHESFNGASMGIGAGFGKALVPAWQDLPVLERTGFMGPELNAPRVVQLSEGEGGFLLRNWGALDLQVSLAADLFTVEPSEDTLAPGEAVFVTLTSSGAQGHLNITSNDPDEPSVKVPLSNGGGSLGEVHDDFSLTSFTWPDSAVGQTSLSDFDGRPVLIAYWALF